MSHDDARLHDEIIHHHTSPYIIIALVLHLAATPFCSFVRASSYFSSNGAIDNKLSSRCRRTHARANRRRSSGVRLHRSFKRNDKRRGS